MSKTNPGTCKVRQARRSTFKIGEDGLVAGREAADAQNVGEGHGGGAEVAGHEVDHAAH
jgi:hypothetical protein